MVPLSRLMDKRLKSFLELKSPEIEMTLLEDPSYSE
jgi:hypothetical protein